ncbi:uncharacterized protein PAN0_018d5614 [Moesziomyces antarcticus]|uniref:Uncharacterized protein n=2 Tax=Pseudozyma antarctica TaxID=84753 RepID=A0A5C3FW44_PSEA2|nr:uncharacterized protein PAN0_018d5614 [Moesziomyces antarcticus]GAK67387.1 hypothetical protein PAN0_018d5614 [Moesziomyces antarcticus]SPO48638.1 uncharacterized protein PSANT_06329 [Moesziomyces antarcticus]
MAVALPIARIYGCWLGRQRVRPLLLLSAAAAASPPAKLPKLLNPNVQQHQPASFRPCPKGIFDCKTDRRTDHTSPDALRCSCACLPLLSGLIADDEARLFSPAGRSAASVGSARRITLAAADALVIDGVQRKGKDIIFIGWLYRYELCPSAFKSRSEPRFHVAGTRSTAAPSAALGFRNQNRLDCPASL